jgi:NAD-dependent oxidoreductase involved in siderophore biosynthesis
MATCIFCRNDRTLSAEHVFAEWIRPYLTDEEGEHGTHHRVTIRAGEPDDAERYRGPPANWTFRSVCKECNNGWMSQLENELKPYLLSMINGHRRAYYAREQELIATWLVKTALVTGSKFDPLLPFELLHRLQ